MFCFAALVVGLLPLPEDYWLGQRPPCSSLSCDTSEYSGLFLLVSGVSQVLA